MTFSHGQGSPHPYRRPGFSPDPDQGPGVPPDPDQGPGFSPHPDQWPGVPPHPDQLVAVNPGPKAAVIVKSVRQTGGLMPCPGHLQGENIQSALCRLIQCLSEWWFYALSSSKAILRVRTYSLHTYSVSQ